MRNKLILGAMGKVMSRYGEKWAKIGCEKALFFLNNYARKKGLTDRPIDLGTLTARLKEMYRQGGIDPDEWEQIKAKLRQVWRERGR